MSEAGDGRSRPSHRNEQPETPARDIAQEALRRSERLARSRLREIETIYNSVHVGLCVFDRKLRYIRINERLAEINGVPAAEHIGRTVRQIVPDLADAAEELAERIFRTGEPVLDVQVGGVTAARPGVQRHWIEHWHPLKNDSGKVTGIHVVVHEVTEQKLAEDRLAYLASFPQRNPNPVMELDLDGDIRFMNRAAVRLFPDLAEQGISHPWLANWNAVMAPFREGQTETGLRDVTVGERTYQQAFYHSWREGFVRIYGFDITHRKQAEVALQELNERLQAQEEELRAVNEELQAQSEELQSQAGELCHAEQSLRQTNEELEARVTARTADLSKANEALHRAGAYNRSLIEASLDPLVTIGPDGKITDVNAATEAATGCAREELIGTDFCDYFTEPTRAQAGYRQVFRDGFVRDYPLEIRHKDGRVMPVLYNASVYRDEHGEVIGVFAAARDVTELRRAERAVRAERQRFNDVLETLPAYLVLLTPDCHVSFANRFFRERFGESRGRRCFEYLFGRTEPCDTYTVLKTNTPHRWEWTGPDGRNYDVYDFPFTDTDGSRLIMEMGIDITERKRAEAALREANETLEQRIDARTAALQEANERLQGQAEGLAAQEEELRTVNEELRVQELALQQSLRETRRTAERLNLLSDTAAGLLAAEEPQVVVESLCQAVMKYLDCQVFFNFLVDERAGRLRLNACAGIPKKERKKIEWLDYGVAVCGCVARDGQRIVAEHISESDDERTALAKSCGIRAYACHPIVADARVLGTLSFGAKTRDTFRDDELSLMKAVTDMVAIAVQRQQTQQALRESERQYRNLFERMNEGFALHEIVYDHQGRPCDYRFLEVNPAFEQLTGLKSRNVVGRLASEVLPGIEPYWAETFGRVTLTGEPTHVEQYSAPLGRHYDVFCYRPAPGQFAVMFMDITRRKKMEEAIKDHAVFLQTLIDAIPAPVFYKDAKGIYTGCNTAFEDYLGLKREQIIGRDVYGVAPKHLADIYCQKDKELFETGDHQVYETRVRYADGKERDVIFYKRPLPGTNVDPDGLVGVILDITDRKLMEAELRRLNEQLEEKVADRTEQLTRSIDRLQDEMTRRVLAEGKLRKHSKMLEGFFQHTITPLAFLDHQFNFVRVNDAYARANAKDPKYFIGKNHFELYPHGENQSIFEQVVRTRQPYRAYAKPFMYPDNPQRVTYWDWQLTPLISEFGDVQFLVLNLADVTEQQKAFQELERRAGQLQQLTLELSQAEDRERRRLAEILHDDLQQLLAAAKFHLGILGSRIKDDESAQEITGQINQMLRDAIDQSRSLSHELSPSVLYEGDLGETFEWLAQQVKSKHGLTVHVEAQGRIESRSDALRAFLYRTAQEMLFNVVKHARAREARLRLRSVRGSIWMTISDRGRGFDPKALSRSAGFGLLSIRERVELLGGRMKIHSAPDRGSTFLIAVPDHQAAREAQRELAGASLRGRPMPGGHGRLPLRVLLVDDHEVMREGLAILLGEQEDMEVVGQAGNGREAVELAGKLTPDVVVMDASMPVMAGDEATRQIKRLLPATRVIGLSMSEESQIIRKMRTAGAEAYLLKTAPSEELLAAIRQPRG